MTGLRPIVDLSYPSFLYMAMDQLVKQAARARYMFGGQASVPVGLGSAMFFGMSTGAHHSDRPYPMFMNVPGLKIIVPATPSDAKGLLGAAMDMGDPVLSFETCLLWGMKEEVADAECRIPFGVARVHREGADVTIVGISTVVHAGLRAAAAPEAEGVSAEIAAIAAEEAFGCLKAPVIRVTTPDTQIPFSPAIEEQLHPDAKKPVAAVRKVMSARDRVH